MNVLVAQQGEQIDALADNVDHAAHMTGDARDEVTKAKRLQDINRRCGRARCDRSGGRGARADG